MTIEVLKQSGEKEKFDEQKFQESLKKAGAEKEVIERITKEIKAKLQPNIPTTKIEKYTSICLKRENPVLAARYNLKRALFELGPTGYPFEKYVAQILEQYGYQTKTNIYLQGKCVTHEIDVVAQNFSSSFTKPGKFLIECKYHNQGGVKSDLKVAMYTYARFLDLQNKFDGVWLVTNTKCTSEAISYAKCMNLKIISWKYPPGESLENLIEAKGLYPITVLHLPRYIKRRLIENNIFLVGDLARKSPQKLSSILDLKLNSVKQLQAQAQSLCFFDKIE